MRLVDAINAVREYAEARALDLDEKRGMYVDSVFLLQAAAYVTAQACGISDRAELKEAEDATWDVVARATKVGHIGKGGDA